MTQCPVQPTGGNPLLALRPRIAAGLELLLGLGRHDTVEDDSEEEVVVEEEEEEGRQRFDRELPSLHSYLGEGREVRGRGDVEDGMA